MKVRVKETGAIFHIQRDLTSQMLVSAGIIEELPNVIETPLGKAVWALIESTSNDERTPVIIRAKCDVCSQTFHFCPKATPQAVAACKFWHCTKGETVPEHIAKAYIERGGGWFCTPGEFHQPAPEYGKNLSQAVIKECEASRRTK